jgi:hypothetical protein
MRLINSTQTGIRFAACKSPVTIDKSASWGAGNRQEAPNGAFLKMDDAGLSVSHLVQPREDWSAPIGWVPTDQPGLYDKAPIWVTDEVLEAGVKVHIRTADGPIDYDVKEPSMVCYNSGPDGQPNREDGWVQTLANLEKNYRM